MGCNNYYRAKMILESNKKRILKIDPTINDTSGIYVFHRIEDGIKRAYVGLSNHLLTRISQHLTGYQHIDLSLRKHGFYNFENKTGYKISVFYCYESELNDKERFYIKQYADAGYQLLNKTIGGQDKGKSGLGEQRASKGYHDGLNQGYLNAYKEIKEYFDKYLIFAITPKDSRKKMELQKKSLLKNITSLRRK